MNQHRLKCFKTKNKICNKMVAHKCVYFFFKNRIQIRRRQLRLECDLVCNNKNNKKQVRQKRE